MFGNTTKDVEQTLMRMQEQARIECNHNQTAMAQRMAEFMAQDRRFDSIPDKVGLAANAMDARSHGRVLDLTVRYNPRGGGVPV